MVSAAAVCPAAAPVYRAPAGPLAAWGLFGDPKEVGKFHGDAGMSNPLMASIHLIRAADPPTNKPNVQVGRRTRPLRYLGAYGLSRGVGRLNMLVTRCNGVKLC